MRKQIQWIGMVSLWHSTSWWDGYYITSLYDHKSWDAEWVIDGPHEYYNALYFGEWVSLSKINKKSFYEKMTGGHFEDNSYYKLFRITKMLNVE